MFRRPPTLSDSHLHRPDGLQPAARRARVQVLARGLLRHRYLPYGAVPPTERERWLSLQLAGWRPFASTGCAATAGRHGASLWAWDEAAQAQRLRAAGLERDAGLAVLPETLLQPPQEQGLRLQACLQGVEAQAWRDGDLIASRWWPEPPEPATWRNFARGTGLANLGPEDLAQAPQARPAAHGTAWAAAIRPQDLGARRRLQQHLTLAALVLALAVPTLVLVRDWSRERQALATLEPGLAEVTAAAAPVAKARAEALKLLAAVEAHQRLVGQPDMLAVLAHLAERLPADGTQLQRLEWDGGQLRLTLAVPPGVSRVGQVKALEDGGWLQDVREDASDAGAGGLQLVARLVLPRPASPGEAAPLPAIGARR